MEGMITEFRGTPVYGVPLDEFNISMILELEEYIKIMWHGKVSLISQRDECLMMTKVSAFQNEEESPFFVCYLKNVPCHLQSEVTEAYRILGDVIGMNFPVSKPPRKVSKPPLGKLRKVPTCECCGGEIDFETLTCKYCKTKYYIEGEDINDEHIHISTDARTRRVGYTCRASDYNKYNRTIF